MKEATVFKPREARLPTMEELPDLDPLHFQIVNFAGYIIEAQRPRLLDKSLGYDLHPTYRKAFRNEKTFIQQMVDSSQFALNKAERGLNLSKSLQQNRAEVQAWLQYADIFNSAYPLVLHDPKAALQILALKAPSSFWYHFWSWSSECEEESFETFGLIQYLCHEVVPELCYMPQQAQARDEALDRVKPKLRKNEMSGWGMSMALQATGLSI